MKEILTMIVSLVIVVGIIYGTYWICRRLPGAMGRQSNAGDMKVLARTMIGKDQSVMVIQVDDQQYLLGCTPQTVTLLDKLEKPFAEVLEQKVSERR